jgi:sugar transferase EpsL
LKGRGADFYRRRGKRMLDLLLAGILLALLSPLIALVAAAARALTGSPILYRQNRPGLGGRLFELIKFRTMNDALAPDGRPLPDAERLTPLGRLLRRLSLDEIPELLNVVRGEMSLVGPRPLLEAYLPRYTARQARRHLVRPGITGWAQVNGRNTTTWDQRLLQDEW